MEPKFLTYAIRSGFAALLATLGCSSGGSGSITASDTGSVINDTSPTDDVASEIPPGPCGVKVGDTLCDVALNGYMRNETTGLATSATLALFKLSEVLASGTQKYALVYNAAFW